MASSTNSRPLARKAAALFAVAAALLSLSCTSEQGSTFECSCTFLTDFDDGSALQVSVCAPSQERVPEIARGCAQSGAPAPVQACACVPKPKALEKPCRIGECELVHRNGDGSN